MYLLGRMFTSSPRRARDLCVVPLGAVGLQLPVHELSVDLICPSSP